MKHGRSKNYGTDLMQQMYKMRKRMAYVNKMNDMRKI